MITQTRGRNFVTDNNAIISPKQRLPVDDFSEGLIDKVDINMLPSNAIYAGSNIMFDAVGSVATRKGCDILINDFPEGHRTRSMGWYGKDGQSSDLVFTYSDKVAIVDYDNGTYDDIITGMNGTDKVADIFTYQNKLYVAQEEDPMKVYDGEDVWDAGLTPPTDAPGSEVMITAPTDRVSAKEGDAGNLTGSYKYVVTFENEHGESGQSPESSVRTVEDKKIDVENVPKGPEGTTARHIYRTKAYGMLYFHLYTLNDNTTTAYEDNNTDDNLDDDRQPPDKYKLDGDYQYRVTFVYDERGESSPSPASDEIEVDEGKLKVTDIPVGGDGVTERKLYRTKGDSDEDDMRLVEIIEDNITTEYEDNKADSALTTQLDVEENPPPNLKMAMLKRRAHTIWAVPEDNPIRVMFSKPMYPEIWPKDNYIDLPTFGEEIMGFIEFFDSLYVFCKRAIFKIDGDTIDEVSVSVLSQAIGCAAKKTLKHLRQDVAFLSYDGLFTLSRVVHSGSPETVDVTPMSERVGKMFERITWEHAAKAYAGVYKEMYLISFPVDGSEWNNFTYVYYIPGKNWAPQTGVFGSVGCYTIGDLETTNDYKLYFGVSTQEGKLYSWPGTTYTDDGRPINSWFVTAPFTGKVPEARKRWDELFLETELSGAWDLYLWYRTKLYDDLDAGWSEKKIDLTPEVLPGAGFIPAFADNPGFVPVTSFGGSATGLSMLSDTLGKKLAGTGRYMQIKVGNNNLINTHFKVYRIMAYCRIKKPRAT